MFWMLIISLWVIDVLNHLSAVSLLGGIVSFVIFIGSVVSLIVDGHKMEKSTVEMVKRMKKYSFILACILIPLAIITPNKSTLMVMCGVSMGSKALEEIGNHDEFIKIRKIIDLKLDKYIKDLEQVDDSE